MNIAKFSGGRPNGLGRRILIVGGGTAGWMTAAYLARALGTDITGGASITLIEAPDIPSVGVGEGSFPSIRSFLRKLGIDEADFVRSANATFKQGIRFDNWKRAATDGGSAYFHPFEGPFSGEQGSGLVSSWLRQDPDDRLPFGEAMTFQTKLADHFLAPKRFQQGSFDATLNYAYHFDASKLASFLANQSKLAGVRHIRDRVSGVELLADGSIGSVVSAEHGVLTADLYIDCTGTRSELLGRALGVPFKSVADVLFTDRAVVCQVATDSQGPLSSYTISTAQRAGWTWDIELPERRGVGYVYSSQLSSEGEAERVLREYLGGTGGEVRYIAFAPGYRTRQWVKNCVAVGLSAGFLEPLESTGLMLIEAATFKIGEFLGFDGPVDASAETFNEQMVATYDNIVNFLKLHYCLSTRQEPFWIENRAPESIPDRLHTLLDRWRFRPPSRYDFVEDFEAFAYTSYQFILYGMDFATQAPPARPGHLQDERAERQLALVQDIARRELELLPTHRALIERIRTRGF